MVSLIFERFRGVSVFGVIAFTLAISSCRQSGKEHPDHSSHSPQPDTIQSATHEHHTHADTMDELAHLIQSPAKTIISSQETVKPQLAKTPLNITAMGYIMPDERRNNKIAARTSGRIERLYVNYNYQQVKKGEKILELYSPQLLTVEEELLFLLKNDTAGAMIEKAREKLRLLGVSERQLFNIEKSGTPEATIALYSPYSGYVLFEDLEATSQKQMTMGESSSAGFESMTAMSGTGNRQPQSFMKSSGTQIREGDYVSEGQTLFMVNDFAEVWALASFDVGGQVITAGTPVTIMSESAPEKTFEGKINLVEPVFESGQKFTRARIYIKNEKGILKPNAYVTVTQNKEMEALTIPLSSVFDLGKRKVVFVKIGKTKEGIGIFEARWIKPGMAAGDRIQVIEGLTGSDEIAKDAGYLIDSESLLR
ncbi:MAG TPA: efflux RND transporter periplasmic adaptor subunit [Chitinophagales bacterium]|nr:efflux RND transporter periplasmic adaptor subunit [Chitinophagales bacterium]